MGAVAVISALDQSDMNAHICALMASRSRLRQITFSMRTAYLFAYTDRGHLSTGAQLPAAANQACPNLISCTWRQTNPQQTGWICHLYLLQSLHFSSFSSNYLFVMISTLFSSHSRNKSKYFKNPRQIQEWRYPWPEAEKKMHEQINEIQENIKKSYN